MNELIDHIKIFKWVMAAANRGDKLSITQGHAASRSPTRPKTPRRA